MARNEPRTLQSGDWAKLIILLALLLGAWLRFTPAILAGFPINDGGMFDTIISDLGKNNYALPAFTTFNGGTIPLAYPPLGFYVARILIDLFHTTSLQVLLWLPAVISLIAIPAYFFLAHEILETEILAALATLIFALSPRSFSWFVMGGGLTRAFGLFNLLLTLAFTSRLYKTPSPKILGLTILFGGLTVLSHPEAIVHTLGAAILLWITNSRKKTALINGLKVCAGVLVITSPWWGTVLIQHGLTPFLNASQTGFHYLFFALFPFYFTEEPMMTIIAVLGLIGLFSEIHRRRFFLPAWVLTAFLVEPRSAAWVANLALTMLAALTVVQIILPGLDYFSGRQSSLNGQTNRQGWSARLLVGYLMLYLLVSSYLYALNLSTVFLSSQHREAMAWTQTNTPAGSRFILLTSGADYPMRDPIQEWFPALTERISLTTMQGQEWTFGSGFGQAIDNYREIQACASQQADCIESKAAKIGLAFDYLYVNKKSDYQLGAGWAQSDGSHALIQSVKAAQQYRLVFENPAAAIFAVKTSQ